MDGKFPSQLPFHLAALLMSPSGGAAFFYNTTTQRPAQPKKPGDHTSTPIHSSIQPSIRPFFRKSSKPSKPAKPTNSKTDLPDSSSSSRASHSSQSGLHETFGDLDDQALLASQSQLTRSRTQGSQASDGKPPSANLAFAGPATGAYGPGASVWVGAGVAVLDSRKVQPLTPEQKAEQKYNREKKSRERAAKKAAAKQAKEKGTRTQGAHDNDTTVDHDRNGSISSNSLENTTTGGSSNARPSSDPTTSSNGSLSHPFEKRHGRRYLRDTTLPYPLPCDLIELHRQTLRTMLLVQVFGGPVCTPNFHSKYPKRVLEVACGTGYWSSLCHQYFHRRGHSVSFTGIDIAPLAPDMSIEEDMKWRFVQHDLRRTPLPFKDEEFDLVMIKDLSLVTPTTDLQQDLMDEYLRILKPGGSLEIWDGDHTLRMLLPHAPPMQSAEDSESEDEEQERANATGTYTLTSHTPLTSPQNPYLMEYNGWISKALENRKLTPMPCTHIRPMLLQESEDLAEIESRRLAIPLGEVRWEREGVGGAITKDGASSGRSSHSYSAKGKIHDQERRTLSNGQIALRQTALLTLIQKIEALEPLLREASGKGQDEWDRWQSNMMNDLMKNNGTSWGECLEVGAWWATKKGKDKERPA